MREVYIFTIPNDRFHIIAIMKMEFLEMRSTASPRFSLFLFVRSGISGGRPAEITSHGLKLEKFRDSRLGADNARIFFMGFR